MRLPSRDILNTAGSTCILAATWSRRLDTVLLNGEANVTTSPDCSTNLTKIEISTSYVQRYNLYLT